MDAKLVDCVERQLLEVEALEAVYDGTEAFALEDESWCQQAQFMIDAGNVQELHALSFNVTIQAGVRVRFTMSAEYPASEPARVTIEHPSLVRKELEDLNQKLQAKAALLLGEESALELVQEAEELLEKFQEESTLFNLQDATEESSTVEQHTLLLRIDHMNDTTAYIKKLQGWIFDLGLRGRMFYRIRDTPCNASSGGSKLTPKRRAENIVLLLEGEQTAAFMKLLRTARLTSQDRREKKSSIVWETCSREETPVAGPSWEAMQYGDWSDLTEQWASLGLQEKGGPSFQECFQLKAQSGSTTQENGAPTPSSVTSSVE
jgi:hypothetical protein